MEEVRSALTKASVDAKCFNSHSLRMGAATVATARGLEDNLIQTLGRWETSAFLRYVRIPRADLVSYTKVLAMTNKQ